MPLTKEEQRIQGKKNRRIGAAFEIKVRKNMISKGWIVDKFTNNIDLDCEEIVQAKSNQWGSRSTGFPDFLMFRQVENHGVYKLIFVECKCNGKLSKKEKLKMNFLIKQGHKCFVAYKDEKNIIYKEFLGYEDKTGRMAGKSTSS